MHPTSGVREEGKLLPPAGEAGRGPAAASHRPPGPRAPRSRNGSRSPAAHAGRGQPGEGGLASGELAAGCEGAWGLRAGGNPVSPTADQALGPDPAARGCGGQAKADGDPTATPHPFSSLARGSWNSLARAVGELCPTAARRPLYGLASSPPMRHACHVSAQARRAAKLAPHSTLAEYFCLLVPCSQEQQMPVIYMGYQKPSAPAPPARRRHAPPTPAEHSNVLLRGAPTLLLFGELRS